MRRILSILCLQITVAASAQAQIVPNVVSTTSTGVVGDKATPQFSPSYWYTSGGGFPNIEYNYAWLPDSSGLVFASNSSNFIKGDTNNATDIYQKTISTKAIKRLSTDSSGTQFPGNSTYPVISPNKALLAFNMTSKNAPPSGSNPNNVYIKNLVNNKTTLVSSSSTGTAFGAQFSPDSTKLMWYGYSYSDQSVVYIKTLSTGVVDKISVGSDMAGALFSKDGNSIFYSAFNYNPYPKAVMQLYMRNILTGATKIISSNSAGVAAPGGEDPTATYGTVTSFNASMSSDSAYVAFDSSSPSLVQGDVNQARDVFVKNIQTNKTTLMSSDVNGKYGNNNSKNPQFSPNAPYLLFESQATNLTTDNVCTTGGAVAGKWNVYIKNITNGKIALVSVNSNGESFGAKFSPDGKNISYISTASDLVFADNNNASDIFVVPLSAIATALQ